MKIIKKGSDARVSILKGINQAVDLAKVTLGGKGRIVMIDSPLGVHGTFDGVTVIRNTSVDEVTEDVGVKLVLEVAEKQVKDCGDGTTSASVILQALANLGIKNITAGADAIKIKRGIERAIDIVVDELRIISKKVTRKSKEIKEIATISAHGDSDVGGLIYEAISKTGKNSIITVEESNNVESYLDIANGLKVKTGWLSPLFVNNEAKGMAELDEPYILIYEGKINDVREIFHLLDEINSKNGSLLIVSPELNGEPLSVLAINNRQGKLKVCAIAPFGANKDDAINRMSDLAIATGGVSLSPDKGHELKKVTLDQLGRVAKIKCTQHETIFIGDNRKSVAFTTKISDLESLLSELEKDSAEYNLTKSRLAALNGGIGIIYVGGVLESEIKERKDRIDDALGSALSSLEDGIVPGGGISLITASKKLTKDICLDSDEQIGVDIVKQALELPFRLIIENAGLNADVVLNELKGKKGKGYDVVKGEIVDMIKGGILDPTKVEISLIKNASSVACRFLITEGLICNKIG